MGNLAVQDNENDKIYLPQPSKSFFSYFHTILQVSLVPLVGFILFLISTLLVDHGASNKLDINYTKDELIQVLEVLNGGSDSSVPDFLFFTKTSLKNYTNKVGLPRNRTELRRTKPPKAPNRTDAEVTLSKAQRLLRNGKQVEVITRWARILDMLLFSDLEPEITECTAEKVLGNVVLPPCSKKKIKKKKIKTVKEISEKRSKGQRLLDILVNGNEKEVEEEEEEDDINKLEEEDQQFRWKRSAELEKEDRREKTRHHMLKAKSPVQPIDLERMRRSLSYTYSDEGTCYAEGSEGSTSATILLCETCYKVIDFGSDV